MTIRPVGAEIFHEVERGRQMDRYDEADGHFSQFCKQTLKRFHIKILGNVPLVSVYSTGACCIIWSRYLLLNIADVSS